MLVLVCIGTKPIDYKMIHLHAAKLKFFMAIFSPVVLLQGNWQQICQYNSQFV
jgi:hypothetical protein